MTVYKNILMWIFRFSQQILRSLVSYEALCSLTVSYLSFEGSWFNRFERTPLHKMSVNRLPDFAVSQPRNNNPNLQSYIAEQQNDIQYSTVFPPTSTSSPQIISSFDLLYMSDWYVSQAIMVINFKNVQCNRHLTIRKGAEKFRRIPSRTCSSGIS